MSTFNSGSLARDMLCGPTELKSLRLKCPFETAVPPVGCRSSIREKGEAVEEVLRRRMLSGITDIRNAVQDGLKLRRMADLVLSYLPETQLLQRGPAGGMMHSSTGSANVDLFFHVGQQCLHGTNRDLETLLDRAWKEDPNTCLKLIFQMGSRKGKQDRYGFYDACLWLHRTQPATLLSNLEAVPKFGCWKGLCEIVARVCEGCRAHARDRASVYKFLLKEQRPTADDGVTPWLQGDRLQQATAALQMYHENGLYRALHNRVAEIFAEQLRLDLQGMKEGKPVSLCAKWCPALGNSFDRRTLLCESIARHLFPATLPEYAGLTASQYAFRVRDRLRREVLTPLKEYRKEPQVLISAKRWGEIQYERVPADCMRVNKDSFKKHDPARFDAYIQKLKEGKARATRGQQQPHQLVQAMHKGGESATIAKAQWQQLVKELRGFSAVACCDASFSMDAEAAPGLSCIDIATALTVLVANADGPFHGQVISFAEQPELKSIPTSEDVPQQVRAVRAIGGQQRTSLAAIFDLLLQKSGTGSCPQRVFIFSDMDFSQAIGRNEGSLETDFACAQRKFEEKGIIMPKVIFWNLMRGTGAPALACTPRCALISGYAPSLIKKLLQADELDPLKTVAASVSSRNYRQLYAVLTDAEACGTVQSCLESSAVVVSAARKGLEAKKEVCGSKALSVDLCFVVDCTGSMGSEIRAAKDTILNLVEVIKYEVSVQSGAEAGLRLACVAYRDHCDGARRLQQISFKEDAKGYEEVRMFIENQQASGGGDAPEDVFGGLDAALRFEWGSQLRFMVLIADAPCHGMLYHSMPGDSLPKGDPSGLTHLGLVERMNEQEISLFYLGIGDEADRMVQLMDRCHRQGPIVRMKMDRGCRDYSTAFQERIASAVVRKITAMFQHRNQGDDAFQFQTPAAESIRRAKRKTQEISVELAYALPAEKAAHCIGQKGENIQRCKVELQAILEKAANELNPCRPWEWSGEGPPQKSQQRPGRKFTMRKTKPAVWLDVKRLAKDSFSVVLTLHTRLRDEIAKEAWRRVQTMALEWLRSQGVDEKNLHAGANPQLRLAQHNGKGSISNAQLGEQSKRAAEAREAKRLEMLRSRAPFRAPAIHGREFSTGVSFHMPRAEREAVTDPEGGICTSRSLKRARRSKQQRNKGRSQRKNLRNKRARLDSNSSEDLPMKTAAEDLSAKGNSKRLRRKELERKRRQDCCM